MTLCQELKEHSYYIRDWIEYKTPVPNENTLTEWLIYDLEIHLPRGLLNYTRFNIPQEAKNGADWDWVFIFDNMSYVLRIQAKTLDPKNNYDKIYYPSGTATQINKLLASSASINAIPIYAFYTNSVNISKCCVSILNEGVYLASAQKIHDDFVTTKQKNISKDNLSALSFPLSCLACCKDNYKDSSGIKFGNFLKNYLFMPADSIKDFQLKYLPNYIQVVMDTENDILPDWYYSEFKNNIQDLDGVLIFDFKSKFY